MARYIDPRTDFGFKRLFGQEDSKDILKQFLFDVLELPHPIQELSHIPVEQLPASPLDRRGIYDVYCVDTSGRRFIVEMQRGAQTNIKERALYYTTFALNQQSQHGAAWEYNLLPFYCIVVLEFQVVEDDNRHLRRIQLADVKTGTVFYDKLTFVYIELPKFNGFLAGAAPADRWVYLLKYLPELQDIRAELETEPFTKAFAIAEEAALTPEERWFYEGSLKEARDHNAELTTAHEKGRRNREIEIARSMLAQGLAPALIRQITGLSEDEIASLLSL